MKTGCGEVVDVPTHECEGQESEGKPVLSLLALKAYMQQHGRLSLDQLAKYFGVEPDAVRPLLKRWEAKGHVKMERYKASCGVKCSACGMATICWYSWQAGEG